MSIPHIVIIEDNLPDVLIFREALARRGIAFTIEHFSDGEKAADAVAATTAAPDLFILDLNLPRVDGHALLRLIRERELTARTPVAILTTSRSPADRSRCEELGVDAFIVKPAGFTEFMDLIGSTVQHLLGGGDEATHAACDPWQRVMVNSLLLERGVPLAAIRPLVAIRRLAAILRRARRAGGKTRAARSPE